MDDTREFKISLHAEDDDDLTTTKAIDQPSGSLTAKASTLFVVLALLAFGGIIGFLYYNLNSKIQTINNRGSEGIENLANEFNDKLAEFSRQFYDQKETIRLLQSELDTKLKKLDKSVSAIQTAKLDKKDLGPAIDGIQSDIVTLKTSVKTLNAQLTDFQAQTKQITVQLQKVQTGVLNNKKEISTLDAIHIDRTDFEQVLKKEREFNQQNMAHASEALFSEIATLPQLIKNLEKKIEQTTTSSKKPSTKSPSGKIYVPKPGEIIEQEIK